VHRNQTESIECIADAKELAVMLVPDHMGPDIRRYIASQGRVFTTAQAQKLLGKFPGQLEIQKQAG
jgi:hypothetical protein